MSGISALSTQDLYRLETAMRTLLSPLAAPSVDAWRQEAMRAMTGLFEAESATFHVTGYGLAVHQIDEETRLRLTQFTSPAFDQTGVSEDPELQYFSEFIIQNKVEVWDMHLADHILGGTGAAWKTVFYNELLVHVHAGDTQSLFYPGPNGVAHLSVHDLHRRPEPGGYLQLLRVMLPAFKSGLDMLRRIDAHRLALDTLDEPVIAYGPDGQELHRNGALVRLLDVEPERERLTAALRALGQRLALLAFSAVGEPGAPVEATVQTRRGVYRLRGTLLAPGMLAADGSVLIGITVPHSPALPDAAVVRERHGLTRREAEVALLVAEGLTNEQVAERLFVSLHTVRHHVEAVLAKLEVPGRAAVATRLLAAG